MKKAVLAGLSVMVYSLAAAGAWGAEYTLFFQERDDPELTGSPLELPFDG